MASQREWARWWRGLSLRAADGQIKGSEGNKHLISSLWGSSATCIAYEAKPRLLPPLLPASQGERLQDSDTESLQSLGTSPGYSLCEGKGSHAERKSKGNRVIGLSQVGI